MDVKVENEKENNCELLIFKILILGTNFETLKINLCLNTYLHTY